MADSITNVLIPTQTGATRLFLGPAREAGVVERGGGVTTAMRVCCWVCNFFFGAAAHENANLNPINCETQGGTEGSSHVTSQEHICWPAWPGSLHDARILMVSWCEVDMVATLGHILPHTDTHTQSRVGRFFFFFLLLASRQFVVTLLNYVFPVCLLKCNAPCSRSHLGFLSVLSCTWPQVARAARGVPNELGVKLSLLTDYATKYEIT